VLRSLAGASFFLNRHAETVQYLERAQGIWPDRYITEHAYLHTSFGEVLAHQGKLQLAIEHNHRALELYREAGCRHGEARAIADIGIAQSALGDHEEAVSYLERSIALAQEVGTLHQEGKVRKDLGIVRSRLGQQDKAVECLQQALVLLRRVGDRPMEAETLLALGNVLATQGLEDAACDVWQQAFLIFSAFRPPQSEKIRGPAADVRARGVNGI
jgi:tetratricopeptide (TPR) repeat protein